MFKRRASAGKKSKSTSIDNKIDDSGRTYDASVGERLSLNDSFHILDQSMSISSCSDDSCIPSSPSEDGPTSLDECIHVRREVNQDVLHLIKRHLSQDSCDYSTRSSRRSSTDRQVSFLDQELGLTPRYVVTEIRYRPSTTDKQKHKLYYNSHDFGIFKQEELYEQIESEIQEIETKKRLSGEGAALFVEVKEVMIKDLMCDLQSTSAVRFSK